jgi:putative membrane protein
MIPIHSLPTLNATLNSLSAIFLVTGYISIKRRNIAAHKVAMLSAFVTSSLFLTSYLVYHYYTGTHPFPGHGWLRRAYFTILISHTILAAAIVPMILVTLRRAWVGNFQLHKRIARRTFPLWLYVSVTGVVVYWMLYRLY